jgi:hypothetical protein
LFSNFEMIGDTNEVCNLDHMANDHRAKFFSTNKQSASSLQFTEKHTSKTHFFGEWVAIYFDTNNVIIAYYHNPPG